MNLNNSSLGIMPAKADKRGSINKTIHKSYSTMRIKPAIAVLSLLIASIQADDTSKALPIQAQSIADLAPSPAKQIWTCPMHHQIRQDHPGNCPICGMTLVLESVSPSSSASHCSDCGSTSSQSNSSELKAP